MGGTVDGAAADGSDARRWEFFVGDRPHATAVDSAGRRQPFVQIREAAAAAAPREAVISAEAAAFVATVCGLTPLTGPMLPTRRSVAGEPSRTRSRRSINVYQWERCS